MVVNVNVNATVCVSHLMLCVTVVVLTARSTLGRPSIRPSRQFASVFLHKLRVARWTEQRLYIDKVSDRSIENDESCIKKLMNLGRPSAPSLLQPQRSGL